MNITNDIIEKFTEQFIDEFGAAFKRLPIHGEPIIPVLFSGGVDSLMVALMAGTFAQNSQILLLNVAFGETEELCSDAPDRIQSINSYKHLCLMDKEKNEKRYRLVLINVGKSELSECRAKYISSAIAPNGTVLDDSIGCVIWFATRAKGLIFSDNSSDVPLHDYTKFVLVGSGADEQLGGYARFSTIYKMKGIKGISDEISMEMARIGKRNLGRDDRVGMSNGKSIFAPFLEENFVKWLNGVPTALKTGFSIGKENKFLLRSALKKLGVVENLANSSKRAMQFGSRIAKLEKRTEKGPDICDRLIKS